MKSHPTLTDLWKAQLRAERREKSISKYFGYPVVLPGLSEDGGRCGCLSLFIRPDLRRVQLFNIKYKATTLSAANTWHSCCHRQNQSTHTSSSSSSSLVTDFVVVGNGEYSAKRKNLVNNFNFWKNYWSTNHQGYFHRKLRIPDRPFEMVDFENVFLFWWNSEGHMEWVQLSAVY